MDTADSSGHAVQGMGLRSLACRSTKFEFRRGHECLSLVWVVCCHLQVSATGWPLAMRSPTECGVWVWSRRLDKEEALAHEGLLRQWRKKQWTLLFSHLGKKTLSALTILDGRINESIVLTEFRCYFQFWFFIPWPRTRPKFFHYSSL